MISQIARTEALKCMTGLPSISISSAAFSTFRYQKYVVGLVRAHSESVVSWPWRKLQDQVCLPLLHIHPLLPVPFHRILPRILFLRHSPVLSALPGNLVKLCSALPLSVGAFIITCERQMKQREEEGCRRVTTGSTSPTERITLTMRTNYISTRMVFETNVMFPGRFQFLSRLQGFYKLL